MPSAAAYRPASAALPLLGPIADLIPQARRINQGFRRPPRFVGVLPAGQLYFDSELALDTDGASGLSGDATHQSQTSLRYRGGGSIDANRVPFFVLPLPTTWPDQFDIRLGDFAAVVFAGRVAFAAFADFGPKDNLGEGSLELFRQLGQERVRPNGSVRDVGMGPGIITIVFPKSRLAADLANQDALISALAARGPGLFQELGGVLPMV